MENFFFDKYSLATLEQFPDNCSMKTNCGSNEQNVKMETENLMINLFYKETHNED